LTDNDNGLHTRQDFPILTFRLAGQLYALPVTDVAQVIEMVTLTQLPQAPQAIQGVINVRGQVVPIMDVCLRLGMASKAYHLHTPIILVDFMGHLMGLIVDQVIEVLESDRANLEKSKDVLLSPSTGDQAHGAPTPYLFGVARVGRQLIPILDIGALLNREEQGYLEQIIGNFDLDGALT
jgi:purine-binding chemotaxis protein CheW